MEAVALTRAAMRTVPQVAAEGRIQGQNQTQGMAGNPTRDPQSPEEGQQDIQMRTSAMEEGTSFSTGDISSEVNTTRQEGGTQQMNAQYRETPAHYTTGTPTETGTPEQVAASALDGYMGDELEDVLQNSHLLQGSFTALLAVENQPQDDKPMPLAWIVPDTTNRTLEEIEERTIADFRSPGGGTGALTVLLPRLSQFYRTDRFTVDIDSGEVFAHTGTGWHTAGLRCQCHPFNLNILGGTIIQAAQRFRDEISSIEQTKVIQLSDQENDWPTPPELPPLGDPEMYISYPDVMQLATRKRYMKDRTQVGIAYVVEHSHTATLKGENRYHAGMLDTRLNIIFGRAQAIKVKIDEALRVDDMYRRRRNMRTLMIPTRFPDPANMDRTSNDEWLRWLRHEMFDLIDAIDEENRARQDINDPFNGTAGGVFQPLPESNPGEPGEQNVANPPRTEDRGERISLPNGMTRETPQVLPENNHNTQVQHPNQGGTTPQDNRHQGETPERIVPVQTIRPTPQVQRETRRNAMGTLQPQPEPTHERTPTNAHVQTPLVHPTTAGEGLTGATYQEQQRGRTVEDEISSREEARHIIETGRVTITNQEQQDGRGRPLNTYQRGYGQRQYEERRPPTGARRQISYDRSSTRERVKCGKKLSSCGKNHADLGEFPPTAVLALFVASGGKLSPAPDSATCCE